MYSNPQTEAIKAARQVIMDAAGKAVADGVFTETALPGFSIEIPADSSHGDLASNFALACAKAQRMNPRAIAAAIEERADLEGTPFCKIEIAGPGFINLFYSPDYYKSVVSAAIEGGSDYGRTTELGGGRKCMVEFISANPTGPMHIGNARGGAIGDVLASVLDHSGYNITREFYINDAGNQINKFGNSLAARYHQLSDSEYPFPEDGYRGSDIAEHAKNFAEKFGYTFDGDEEQLKAALVNFAMPLNIEKQHTDLEKYGINYDVWFSESSLYDNGTVEKIMDMLDKNGALYEKDGAIWLNTSKYLHELYLREGKTEQEIERLTLKDDVLKRSNGFYTYFASDIAYHYNKFCERGFDRVINIWGADHHGHVARLKAAMDAIGVDSSRLDIVIMQLVELVRDGETVRMSKRTGKAITLSDLLDEVPIDAARFFFNLREPNSHFEFDLGLAVKQEKDNPVYYVQYAHARMCSVLKALLSDGYAVDGSADYNAALFETAEEKALIRKIGAFPAEVAASARDCDPSRITRFAIDTASLFHRFYTVCRVKDAGSAELTAARTALCLAAKQVIANCLGIMGISAPEVM